MASIIWLNNDPLFRDESNYLKPYIIPYHKKHPLINSEKWDDRHIIAKGNIIEGIEAKT